MKKLDEIKDIDKDKSPIKHHSEKNKLLNNHEAEQEILLAINNQKLVRV